jgi:GNAT superfamily N-acetyltransferase
MLRSENYQFIEQPQSLPNEIPETRIVCLNQEGQEMGWLQYTGLEFDYCVRIQRLYVKPDFRLQGAGSALLRQLKSRYPKAPIFAHLIRVDKDVSLNVVMDFFNQHGFEIKQMVSMEAEGYYNFD